MQLLTLNFSVIENLEPSGKNRRGSWSIRLAKFVSKNVSRKKLSAGDSSSFDDPIDVDFPSRLNIIFFFLINYFSYSAQTRAVLVPFALPEKVVPLDLSRWRTQFLWK